MSYRRAMAFALLARLCLLTLEGMSVQSVAGYPPHKKSPKKRLHGLIRGQSKEDDNRKRGKVWCLCKYLRRLYANFCCFLTHSLMSEFHSCLCKIIISQLFDRKFEMERSSSYPCHVVVTRLFLPYSSTKTESKAYGTIAGTPSNSVSRMGYSWVVL